MVVLEVGIDARGAITGSQQATSALSSIAGGAGRAMAALGGVDTAIAAFGTKLVRFSPILSGLAAIFSGASMAMQLFAGRTDQATTALERQTKALNELLGKQRELDIRAGYGQQDPRRSIQGTIDTLTQLRLQSDVNRSIGISQAAGLFGLPEYPFREALAASGVMSENAALGQTASSFGGARFTTFDVPLHSVITTGEFLLRRQRSSLASETPQYANAIGPEALGASAQAGAYSGFGPFLPGTTGDAMARAGLIANQDAQAMIDAKEHLREMAQLSAEIGANLGDAVFDFATGLRSGRDIMAQLLADLGRGFSRSAMQQLTQGIITSFG